MLGFVSDGSKGKILHFGHRTNKIPDTTTTTPSSIDKQPQRGSIGEKTISILFLSLGAAGQKNLTDKFPYMNVATVPMGEIKENCENCFKKPKNRTLDRYKFFARRQQQNETLRQFWNVPTGLAARCEFGEQTNSLIEDAFKQSMNNKTVQRRIPNQ